MLRSIRLPDYEMFHDGCIRYSIRCKCTCEHTHKEFPDHPTQGDSPYCHYAELNYPLVFDDLKTCVSLCEFLWEFMPALRIIGKSKIKLKNI